MTPNITVAEVMQKELELKNNIQKLLVYFKNETGFYVEGIYISYWDSLCNKRDVVQVEINSRINS